MEILNINIYIQFNGYVYFNHNKGQSNFYEDNYDEIKRNGIRYNHIVDIDEKDGQELLDL